MDPVRNPFAPGAGIRPPALAGRDELLERGLIALRRTKAGRSSKSLVLIGLRGVGKTVLLERLCESAESEGIVTVRIEAPENRSLPSLIVPQLRIALLRLSRQENSRQRAQIALQALAGFVKALKFRFSDIEVNLDMTSEPGLADSSDFETDLGDVIRSASLAAKAAGTALALFIDEIQYLGEEELSVLITVLHRMSQESNPVVLFGAGLPQIIGKLGRAKSYAEGLFEFPTVDRLGDEAAVVALQEPVRAEGADFTLEAAAEILRQTRGYPYYVQEWGKHAWDVALASPITLFDVQTATILAVASLDESFFRVRFERLSPSERRYLRAMADLGDGPCRSADIAAMLGRAVTSLGPTRNNLINKGMVFSPSHGDLAFTVPLFHEFMRRVMPGDDWL